MGNYNKNNAFLLAEIHHDPSVREQSSPMVSPRPSLSSAGSCWTVRCPEKDLLPMRPFEGCNGESAIMTASDGTGDTVESTSGKPVSAVSVLKKENVDYSR